MKDFLLTYENNGLIITIYLLLLSLIAINKFTKNNKNKSIFSGENLFLIFYYVFIAVGPVIALITNKYEYNYNLYIIFGVSLILFLIGADVIIGNKKLKLIKKNSIKENEAIKKEINWKSIRKNATIVLCISYIFASIYLVKNLSFIMQDLENNRISAMTGNGIIVYFSYAMLPATWILYYCHLNDNKVKNMWIYFVIDVIILLLFGFRSRVVELIFMCIIIRDSYQKIKIKTLVKIAIGLIVIVSLLQVIRSMLSSNETNVFHSIKNTMCVASINLIYIFNAFPDKINYQYGYTYLINFQQLLPSHSIDMTMWLKDALNITFNGGGLTPTIIGEFYLNFGFIGLTIGMLITGMVAKFVDLVFRNSKNQMLYFIFIFYFARSVAAGFANFIIIMLWFMILTFGIFNIRIRSNWKRGNDEEVN